MIRMKLLIKKIIEKILSMLGIGIYRISIDKSKEPEEVIAQGLPVKDPISHNTRERMNIYYSNPKIVKEYLSPERIAFYHNLIKLCIDKGIMFSQKNIADVGCGTGHLLKFISEKFDNVALTGFEYSDAAIKVAKTTCPKATFFKFDIYQGTSQQFDVVLCIEVLEHLLYTDKALKNCLKMTRNKVTLIITVPDGRKDTFLGHINFWSPESWKVFIETNCEGLPCNTGLTESGENYAIIRRGNEKTKSTNQ